eukprot:10642908-Karenia_brevis.AAC.1
MWQCGYLGLRVGEASHPGPGSECADTELLDSDSDGAAPSPFKVARLSELHDASMNGPAPTQLDLETPCTNCTLGDDRGRADGHGE